MNWSIYGGNIKIVNEFEPKVRMNRFKKFGNLTKGFMKRTGLKQTQKELRKINILHPQNLMAQDGGAMQELRCCYAFRCSGLHKRVYIKRVRKIQKWRK